MGLSQTKNNLRWSFLVFSALCLFSTAVYVAADETDGLQVTVFDDADGDKLSSEEEKIYGTDPETADTDGDGYGDGVEIEGGFDPLKPAPGDRVVLDESTPPREGTDATHSINFTEEAANKLAALVEEKAQSDEKTALTPEDFDTILSEVMTVSEDDIVLPEIDPETITIKEIPAKLSEAEAVEQNHEDVVEYLTLTGYILLSNLPVTVRNSQELVEYGQTSGMEVLSSVATGNYNFLNQMEERADKTLEEMNEVEVPESMVGVHMKAVKLLTFASDLKGSVAGTVSPEDPLGQMYAFSKIQGGLLVLENFIGETQDTLTKIGIERIPIDI